MKYFIALPLVILSFIGLKSQNISTVIHKGLEANGIVTNANIVRTKSFSSIPNYVEFANGKELSINKLEHWLKNYFQLNDDFGLRLLNQETDQLGYTHYRYQQTVNGIPIKLGIYIAHVKNGLVKSMNGELFNNTGNHNNIQLSETIALSKALTFFGAKQYKWEVLNEEKHLKWEQEDSSATYLPKG